MSTIRNRPTEVFHPNPLQPRKEFPEEDLRTAQGKCAMSSGVIVSLAYNGNGPMISWLAERFYWYVFAIFRYRRLDPEDARDLTQETFLRMIAHLSKGGAKLTTERAAKSLLARIARSVFIDFYRKRNGRGAKARPRPKLVVFSTLETNLSSSDDANPAAEFPGQMDDQVGYGECLEHLRVKGECVVAETVELVAVRGYPLEEAATILGVEVWVIQWRLRRAEQLLRDALA